jgi:3-oxoacyl-[acyl-carrier-protein] synthase II
VVAGTVAVTGAAWTTALGDELESVWARLRAGHDGFVPSPSAHPVRNPLVARVAGVADDPPAALRRIAAATIARALMAANLDPRGAGATLVLGSALADLPDSGIDNAGAWATDVAQDFPERGGEISIATACSAGADAIGIGFELIRTGAAERCVCGGADVVTAAKRYGHSSLSTMSPTRLRSFDQRHDGTLLGDGAGFVVLEAETSARRRGARTDLIIRGVGAANDAASMTSPAEDARGARLAITRALADAGLPPAAVGLVNAHGSGTPMNDRVEASALVAIFGSHNPLVFATKGAFGHTLGATGAIEAIALLIALERGEVPPIAGLEADSADPTLRLATSALAHDATIGISLTLGFGGFDTCLVCEVRG